ncbi:MAG TPA: alpha/beta hydrolase-fold protein [Vicinamibacterales bacterium]|nr:alpha/beta hydrolase-fold protein [Vicinamibacterales bacterium]
MTKRTLERVWSPQLRNRRTVDIYLPASYPSGRRYPVVYMQDGQNLSDPAIAFGGNTWDLDGALERLSASGLEAIIVGVHNMGEARLAEYSPVPDRRHGGGEADAYLEFLSATLKPRIDRLFRTRPDRDETAILGSSMGGLVSLYAYFRFPSIFGLAGVMSPSIWFGQGAILHFVQEARTPPGRLYIDVGLLEGIGTLRDARRLARLLARKGFARDRRGRRTRGEYAGVDRRGRHEGRPRVRYVEDPAGRHNEGSWARRLEGALRFLLE